MDLPELTVTRIVSVSAVVLLLTYYSFSRRHQKYPPSPLRAWPIVGNLLQLSPDPREQFAKFRKQCGNIYSLWMRNCHVVVLNGLDVLKEAFVKHDDDFSDRASIFVNIIPDGVNKGIAFSNGDVWKEHRAFASSVLRNVCSVHNLLNNIIQEEVNHFIELLKSFDGEPKDIQPFTNKCISNIVCSIIIGRRYEYDDSEFVRILELTNYSLSKAKKISLSNYIPWLRLLPGDFFSCKMIKKKVEECYEIFAERHIKDSDDVVGEPNSLISAYLQEMKKKQMAGETTCMDKSNLMRMILDMFVAGTDTTSCTLDWFFLYMVNFPDVQDKIFSEINQEVGLERAVVMQDKANLIYLSATILEVQRLASLVAINLPRILSRDVQFRGYLIPQGTQVVVYFESILHDPLLWGDDAHKFRPERFISKNGSLIFPEAAIPFSIGKRVCLGESMAKKELFLFVSNILQKFEVLPADPASLPPIKGKFNITHTPLAYDVRFVSRSHY